MVDHHNTADVMIFIVATFAIWYFNDRRMIKTSQPVVKRETKVENKTTDRPPDPGKNVKQNDDMDTDEWDILESDD